MKTYLCFICSFLLSSCSIGSEANKSNYKSHNELELYSIQLGGNSESLKERFKEDMVVEYYKDISDLKECKYAENIFLDNYLIAVETDNNKIITSVGTTDQKLADYHGISVGQDEKVIKKLIPNAQSKKIYSGDDSIDFYEYKIQMENKQGYYSYVIDNFGKINSITIKSNDYIACIEE